LTDKYVVVDTNVVSYMLKGHSLAAVYLPHLKGRIIVLSFQTTAELRTWSKVKNWGPKSLARLDEFVGNCLVVNQTTALSVKWAEIMEQSTRRGKGTLAGDAWIAATALLHGVPLVSHDRKDFEWMAEIGLKLLCEAPPLDADSSTKGKL
jgi:tRNA(fMet)-specific endonuclease VapC